MRRESLIVTMCVCLTLIACVALIARGGPLDPPPGPVAPSYQTLAEVDGRRPLNQTTAPGTPTAVHRITQSGSYFLTGDVVAGQNQNAIEIAATDVTIDLNGYALIGESLFTTDSFNGITRAPLTQSGVVTIRNGTIRGFDIAGVNFDGFADILHVQGVKAIACDIGFHLDSYATITECSALNCINQGFFVDDTPGSFGVTVDNNLAVNCDIGFDIRTSAGGHVVVRNRGFENFINFTVSQGCAVGVVVDVTDADSFFGICQNRGLSNFRLERQN